MDTHASTKTRGRRVFIIPDARPLAPEQSKSHWAMADNAAPSAETTEMLVGRTLLFHSVTLSFCRAPLRRECLQRARSALMIDFAIWQGRLSPVIRLHHQHRAGLRRKWSLGALAATSTCHCQRTGALRHDDRHH